MKLNSLAIDLRKKWGVGIYEPLDIFPVVLSNFSNLSILIHPMSKDINGFCINDGNIQIIGINSTYPRNFTLACEMYYLLFGEDIVCKNEANSFASFLLMTDEGLKRYIKVNRINSWNLDKILACEQYFQIDHHAFLIRLDKLGFCVDNEYKNIKRGFLNKPISHCVLGNYIKMINYVDELGGLTDGKKRELLIDGYRGDLVFNKKSNVND